MEIFDELAQTKILDTGKKPRSHRIIAAALDTTVDDLLADVLKKKDASVEKEENSLFAGCTEKQKQFVMAICHHIKEELIKYDDTPK